MLKVTHENLVSAIESQMNVEDIIVYGSKKIRLEFDMTDESRFVFIDFDSVIPLARQGIHLTAPMESEHDLGSRVADAINVALRDGFRNIYIHSV